MKKQRYRVNQNIVLSDKQHEELKQFLNARLMLGKVERDRRIEGYRYIDQEYFCYLRRDHDDHKRSRDNVRGIGVRPVDQKLSFMFSQIDEATTYLTTLLAPESGFYKVMAPKQHQAVADAVAARMNEDAEKFQHFRHLQRFLNEALRYNFAALSPFWRQKTGKAEVPGSPEPVFGIISQGNELVAHDPWNFLYDPSVAGPDTPEEGEFFACVTVQTPFRLKLAEQNGQIFNLPPSFTPSTGSLLPNTYYIRKPDFKQRIFDDTAGVVSENTDWYKFLNTSGDRAGDDSNMLVERIRMFAYIIPKKFGLGTTDMYEIWEFELLSGGDRIVYASPFVASHGMLPVVIGQPIEDNYDQETVGFSERLVPHQQFGSFVLNAHQRAVRKSLQGLTIYDRNLFPQLDPANKDSEPDMFGGRIPATGVSPDMDIRKKFVQIFDAPDVSNTVELMQAIDAFMQQILPTEMTKQVAGLDRATQYQAAAVVQSASKRLLKIGKLLDSQALTHARAMQLANILQNETTIMVLSDGGEIQPVPVDQIKQLPIKFRISDGLRGLDVLALTLHLKEILMAVLQSQQAQQQIDVVGFIDYITTLIGDYTDFKQFKVPSPMDLLPPDQRNLAFQLLEQYQQQQQAANSQQGQRTDLA